MVSIFVKKDDGSYVKRHLPKWRISSSVGPFVGCQCAGCGAKIDLYTAYQSLELYAETFAPLMVCYECFDKERDRRFQQERLKAELKGKRRRKQ